MDIDEIDTTVADPVKITQPKPNDFDQFLPWACRQFSIDTDVIVTRAIQKTYVSATAKNNKLLKLKTKKHLASITSHNGSDDDKSSVLDKPLDNENKVKIETVYDINENLVQLKFLKNKDIPRQVVQTIALTIPFQPYLTSIIIDSGLRMDCLYEISKFLPNSHITELCLDRAYLSQANYDILLMESNIKHLSLARCMINDDIVKTIADQLEDPCPASKVLSALNLSSNRITDVGAKYLADMLRTNRQLSYLNLAGNMITDEGGINILDTLHEFPLHAQELLESRARYVAYLKQKNDLINTLIMELQTVKFDKSPKKKISKKAKLETQSQHHVSLEKPIIETGVDAQIMQERAEALAEKRMGSFDDPFSPNNTKIQDGGVQCFGNNTLCYLNIAYNDLTYACVKKLHEVLSAQKSLNRTPRGLIKVVIEGNLMPVACKEYEEIDSILGTGIGGFRKQGELAMKRKPASSRSTVASGK